MGSLYRRTPKGKYYGEYTGPHGQRLRKSTGTAVKSDAARILASWENKANNERHGLAVDTNASLEELLKEYLDYLGNSGDKHRNHCESRLNVIINANGWTKAAHINQYQLETTVRDLKHLVTGRKYSLRTQAHYLTAAKSFTKWLTNVRSALHRDPLIALRKPGFASDRRRIRRFLLPDEWKWLTSSSNAVLYETAIQTGFRSLELRRIEPHHLGEDCIQLPAKFTKNKQDAKQFITSTLRAKLVAMLPFEIPNEYKLADLLRSDLAIAREAYLNSLGKNQKPDPNFLQPINSAGHILDFHALRHTCGAWLAMSGVNAKVIQSVMRHSTITLTLDTYGHLMPGAEKDAVQHFDRIMAVDLCQVAGTAGQTGDKAGSCEGGQEVQDSFGKTPKTKEK